MRWLERAYICRFGRQSLIEVMGRRPTAFEWRLFRRALKHFLDSEYGDKPATEDD